MYSSVMWTVLWPAIFEALMLDAPSSCRQVISRTGKNADRGQGNRSPRPRPHASELAGRESHSGRPLPSVRVKTRFSGRAFRPGFDAVAVHEVSHNQANEIDSLTRICRKCRIFHRGERSHEIGVTFSTDLRMPQPGVQIRTRVGL